MNKEDLIKYKTFLSNLSETDKIQRDLYLRKFALGELQGPTLGYPSIDKPWLKYYSEKAIDTTIPQLSAYEYIWHNNKNNLNSIAINYYDNKITYEELFQKIEKTKEALLALNIQKGDYVTFCMPTIPETIYLFYALNQIGAICNFIDLRMNKERILKYINDTNSKLIISFHGIIDKIYSIFYNSTASKIIDIDVTPSLPPIKKALYKLKVKDTSQIQDKNILKWEEFIKIKNDKSKEEIPSKDITNDAAAIVYTGGTTGEPKGAVLTNGNIISPCYQYSLSDIPRGHNDKFVNIMPPFIAYGLVDGIELPLSLGMECLLIPKFDPKEFSPLLKKYKPSHFVGIPSHFEMLMEDKRSKKQDLSFIKNAGCGGAAISPSLEEKINQFLKDHNCSQMMRVGYGMTENAAMSIYDLNNNMTKIGRIGIPMPKMTIGVFDENGEELRYNTKGELRISSPAIIKEYFNNKEQTDHTIISSYQQRWIKTGDIANIDTDGNVAIIGRIKSMFIRPDGHNVFPDIISNNLANCPLIKNVCVIGIKSKYNKNGKIPTAIVVLEDETMDHEIARKEILEYQSHLLGERDGALDIRFRKELPITSIGKIDITRIEKEESMQESNIDFDILTANTPKKVLMKK